MYVPSARDPPEASDQYRFTSWAAFSPEVLMLGWLPAVVDPVRVPATVTELAGTPTLMGA